MCGSCGASNCQRHELSVCQATFTMQVDGVADVHDLHVWGIKPGMPILAAHVTTQSGKDGNAVLGRITDYCRSVGIDHSTIQISDRDTVCPCNTYPDGTNATASQQSADSGHEHNHNGHEHAHSHEHGHDHRHSQAGPQTSNGHSHAHEHHSHDHGQHGSDIV